MISQTLEYALRAVVHLARFPDSPQTNRQIAEATWVPEGYLSKVLQGLTRAGMISSHRGLYGGFLLIRPPEELTIYEVAKAVDPLPRIRTCPLGLKSHGPNLCPLHRRLDEAMATVEKIFRSTTVLELISDPDSPSPLCEVPSVPLARIGNVRRPIEG